MRKSVEKLINIDGIDLSICKIATKAEAYKMAFADGYYYSRKENGELIVGTDLAVYAMLKDGTLICAINEEPFSRVPKQSEIEAIIFSNEAGWAFWNEKAVRICFAKDDMAGEFANLEFVNDMPEGYSEIKTFAELA